MNPDPATVSAIVNLVLTAFAMIGGAALVLFLYLAAEYAKIREHERRARQHRLDRLRTGGGIRTGHRLPGDPRGLL